MAGKIRTRAKPVATKKKTARRSNSPTPSMKSIFATVLKRIKPAAKGIPREVSTTLSGINQALVKKKIKATAVLGGSFAKGTYLAGDFDVDIFVRFDKKTYASQDISTLLEEALASLNVERVHGSRDYFQLLKDGIQYEIIPVIAVTKPQEALNVTDCSPLHVWWVEKNIKRLHDDIRLAKQFFKSCGSYGAESYIRGFSGHVIDLLVIMHGGFFPLLKSASSWNTPVVIDYLNAHKGRALATLNPAKTQSPLIIVDPVQPERNASASLSLERFSSFREAAKGFLQNPSNSYFEIKSIDYGALAKKGSLVMVIATPLDGKEDVVGSKLLQSHEYIKTTLNEFKIVEEGWHWHPGNDATFYYVLGKDRLDATLTISGPPEKMTSHASAFRSKHRNVEIVKGKLVATEQRSATTPEEVLRAVMREEYLQNRVKSISIRTNPPTR